MDGEPVGAALAGDAQRPEAGLEHGDPVGLLVAKLAGIAYLGDAVSLAREHRDDRELIDGAHGQRPGDRHRVEPGTTHLDIAGRLDPAGQVARFHPDVRAHRLEHREHAGAPWIQADSRTPHSPTRTRRREREEERR